MKVIGINGSPRKNWNTHTLICKTLEGAASKDAQTELIHLYDLNFKGCVSCLTCKEKGAEPRCVVSDDLTDLLNKIADCDALVIGSPIYFGDITGMTRAFIERLLFPYISYNKDMTPHFNRKIKTAMIYTMNVPEAMLDHVGYTAKFNSSEQLFANIFGSSQTLISTETLQVDDYSQYEMTMFDDEARKTRRNEVFPADCQKGQKYENRR
jgi:multimeric flavodoxin WrbA